jgi:hypothetical protein
MAIGEFEKNGGNGVNKGWNRFDSRRAHTQPAGEPLSRFSQQNQPSEAQSYKSQLLRQMEPDQDYQYIVSLFSHDQETCRYLIRFFTRFDLSFKVLTAFFVEFNLTDSERQIDFLANLAKNLQSVIAHLNENPQQVHIIQQLFDFLTTRPNLLPITGEFQNIPTLIALATGDGPNTVHPKPAQKKKR